MKPFIVALTAFTAVVAVTAIVTSLPSLGAGHRAESPTREFYTFDAAAPMLAASDAVVIATVTGSEPGRSVGDEIDPADNLVFTQVTIEVDQVIWGDLKQDALALEIDESAIPRQDRWDVADTTVLLFLHEKSDNPGIYRPTNSQGVFVVSGDRLVPGVSDDDFTESFSRLGLDKALDRLTEASRAVERGEVTPPPTILEGSR